MPWSPNDGPGRDHVVIAQPRRLEGCLVAGQRIEQHLRHCSECVATARSATYARWQERDPLYGTIVDWEKAALARRKKSGADALTGASGAHEASRAVHDEHGRGRVEMVPDTTAALVLAHRLGDRRRWSSQTNLRSQARVLLHLLTTGIGTTRPSRDVRIHGEYWMVTGPSSDLAALRREIAADRAIKAW
jgi:hypothetical protein